MGPPFKYLGRKIVWKILICISVILTCVLIQKGVHVSGPKRVNTKPLTLAASPDRSFEKYSDDSMPIHECATSQEIITPKQDGHVRTVRDSVEMKAIRYCIIPKVASTYTESLLRKIPRCKEPGICHIDRERHNETESIFSFMWARDPYTRLFSAYENKLFTPNKFWRFWGLPIIKRRRKTPTAKSLLLGHDVTFAELVEDVLWLSTNNTEVNQHVRPMVELCDPCKLHFDFIGRFEQLTADMGVVCNKFQRMGLLNGMNMTLCKTARSIERFPPSRASNLFSILKQHGNDISADDKLSIMDRMWRSYQIRGILLKTVEMPFTVRMVDHVTPNMYTNVINDAIVASQNATVELEAQRSEALVQAYMTVPRKTMARLRQFFRRDFQLFGYNERPKHLFRPRDTYNASFNYFGEFFD